MGASICSFRLDPEAETLGAVVRGEDRETGRDYLGDSAERHCARVGDEAGSGSRKAESVMPDPSNGGVTVDLG